MDLFDIGQDPGYYGQVKQVKILEGLAVVDDDETDWKMMGIDVKDPLAALVNSVKDVEKYRPGTTQAFYDWFAGFEAEKTPSSAKTTRIRRSACARLQRAMSSGRSLLPVQLISTRSPSPRRPTTA